MTRNTTAFRPHSSSQARGTQPFCRIALYSHDTMGLGHVRRNLLIAQTLAECDPQPVILMITGAREAGAFELPPGVDCLTLPALRKHESGNYGARSLNLSLDSVLALRSNIIRAALESFAPDVLIADNVPRGAGRELEPALEDLRKRKQGVAILGMRDVLDAPQAARAEWDRAENEDAVLHYYDRVWVYGDPRVYNPVREYGFCEEVASKVRFTGYLDQTRRLSGAVAADQRERLLHSLGLPPGRLALCLVGGGQDGVPLAEAFAGAELPPGVNGLIVTGPYMPAEAQSRLHLLTEQQPRLRVLEFVPEPTVLLSAADWVVSMGGYNTVCELLSFEKRALIVPRVQPRQEQWVRAERLRDLGLLDLLHPERATAYALSQWLARAPAQPTHVRERIDLGGLTRLPQLLANALESAPVRVRQRVGPGPIEASTGLSRRAQARDRFSMEAAIHVPG